MDFKKLLRPLNLSEIEFRAGTTYQGGGKAYCTVLAYKTPRTDMNILDDVVGAENWQNEYFRDSKGVLNCRVSIWNPAINQWVSKCSNGTESNMDKEKGEYSDAFKRACVMFGIGRCLYDFPKINVLLLEKEFKIEGGKVKVNGYFRPSEWTWEVFEDYKDVKATDKNGNVRVEIGKYASKKKAAPAKEVKTDDKLIGAIADAANSGTLKALTAVWNKYPDFQEDERFKKAMSNRKAELSK